MTAIPLPMGDHEVSRALDLARAMARVGIPIFTAPPCGGERCTAECVARTKGAGNKNGYHLPPGWDATVADPRAVDQWRPGWALCAVGGHACDVLDVDPRNGGDASAEALAARGEWPWSYGRALTPSGGVHDFIAPLGIGKGTPAPGVDLQGGRRDGTGRGFVFIAPTARASKIDGVVRPYRWLAEPNLAALASHGPADQTGAALARLTPHKQAKPKSAPTGPTGPVGDFLDRPLSPELADHRIREALASVTNHILTRGWPGFREVLATGAAYEIGGYVGGEHLSYDQARDGLVTAITAAGQVPNDDDLLWIEQGLSDGAARPLRVEKPRPVTAPPLATHVTQRNNTNAPRRLPLIPERVWTARPWLAAIRERARETDDCPDAVLGAVLGIFAASVPHRVKIVTGIKQPIGTSLLVGLVAPSGLGKSSAFGLALREMSPIDHAPVMPVPTGEGISEMLMGRVERVDPATGNVTKERAQVAHNLIYYIDEGGLLNAGIMREGASVGATLRALFSDAQLGNSNASEDRRRMIAAGNYSLSVIVGFQETTVLPVLRDLNTGMAQRFLWFPALAAPQEPSGLLAIARPELPPVTALPQDTAPDGTQRFLLPVNPAITAALRRDAARKRESIDIMAPDPDSQRPALIAKVAGILCLIEHRTMITVDDWDLASQIYAASRAVRDELLDLAEEQEGAERLQRAAVQGQADVVRKSYPTQVARVAAAMVRGVANRARAGKVEPTAREVKNMTTSRDNPYRKDALDMAVTEGWLTKTPEETFQIGKVPFEH